MSIDWVSSLIVKDPEEENGSDDKSLPILASTQATSEMARNRHGEGFQCGLCQNYPSDLV